MPTDPRLQSQWTELFSKTLPSLARAGDAAQSRWPVTLDHCFARIILDNTVGEGKEQWDKRLKRPAVRNMTDSQLRAAIELGENIMEGKVDLVALDMQSLGARGKGEKKYRHSDVRKGVLANESGLTGRAGKKRKIEFRDKALPNALGEGKRQKQQAMLSFSTSSFPGRLPSSAISPKDDELFKIQPILRKIAVHPSLTPYRKRLYNCLMSVPRGRYTTYAALSQHLQSSARAVGSGMRNNPFAPEVPCHRVLAADGGIGGFGGSWGKDGKHASEKLQLLKGEGVDFDSRGRAIGLPFTDFTNRSGGRTVTGDG